MCGRYTLARSQQELSERFGIEQLFVDLSPRFNIAPTQKVPVIINIDRQICLDAFQWGLIPSWVKDLKKAKPLINARSETLCEKPSFRSSLKKRRCLVPADGFYEWKKTAAGKAPFYIYEKEHALLAFAGIYDEWKDEAGHLLKTFSIITTEANGSMAPLHDRMPVILPPQAEQLWLDPERNDPAQLLPLLRPCPDELLKMHEVSSRVNSVKFDDADLIEAENLQLGLNLPGLN
ncbi:MAG: SOS response-associated peptidase [Candidatus Obscuribacterales bacterium]|nr:SOS response-associated peptidase [Candidatus Obscuribacterales bacterium]